MADATDGGLRALVFESDSPFLDEGAPASHLSPDCRLAGLSLLQRAVCMAWAAGARSVVVARADGTGSLAVGKHPVPVTFEFSAAEIHDEDRFLVLSARVLARPGLLEALTAGQEERGGSLVATVPGAACLGPAVLRGRDLRAALAGGEPLQRAVTRLLRGRGCAPVRVETEAYRHLQDEAGLAAADRALYRGLTSVTDGYIDRVLNRHISRWFTRRIINLPITPNHVTYFHFSLGLLSVWLFWQGGYARQALGALLFQLSVALDCSDGEVARLKYQFSKFGSWLDVVTDNIVHAAVFAAIARAAAVHLGTALSLTLGALAVTGVPLSVLVVFSMAKLQKRLRPGEASSLAVTNRLSGDARSAAASETSLVDRVINEATSRDFSVLVVACALLGRLEWFAWLAGIGSHVFWIVFACIQLSLLRTANAESR